jgi:hypothetical protein
VHFELTHSNKGFEGIHYHEKGEDKFLMGLCEGELMCSCCCCCLSMSVCWVMMHVEDLFQCTASALIVSLVVYGLFLDCQCVGAAG